MLAKAEVDYWDGPYGYVIVDLESYEREVIPGLERQALDDRVHKMYVPGPSFREGHFVVDFSHPDSIGAEVWRAGPTAEDFEKVATLPCGQRQAELDYTAAEPAPGQCLILNWQGQLRNAAGTLIVEDRALNDGEIRLAPGGRWAVPVTRRGTGIGDQLESPIPVIGNDGSVAYTLGGYLEITDVGFSSGADTMFVVGAQSSPQPESEAWSLHVLEAQTGNMIAEIAFGSRVRLRAVLFDPIRPVLYVAGVGLEHAYPRNRVFLAVVERGTWELTAVVPAPVTYAAGSGSLMFGGSSGRIHFLSYCGWDCGGMHDYTFDTQ
jgi:hypothetical protein